MGGEEPASNQLKIISHLCIGHRLELDGSEKSAAARWIVPILLQTELLSAACRVFLRVCVYVFSFPSIDARSAYPSYFSLHFHSSLSPDPWVLTLSLSFFFSPFVVFWGYWLSLSDRRCVYSASSTLPINTTTHAYHQHRPAAEEDGSERGRWFVSTLQSTRY